VIVGVVVRNWRARSATVAAAGPVDVKYQSRVEEELSKFTPED